MHVVILGAGSLGTLFGARLWAGGHTRVTLIARGAHLRQMEKDGIRIVTMSGETEVLRGPGLAFVGDPSDITVDIDYLIVTVKGGDFEGMIEAAASLPPVASVLTFQNGIRFNSRLIERFGRDRVIGAVTMEGVARPMPGTVRHLLAATTYLGELDGGSSERVETLASLLEGGSLHTQIADDIISASWTKFVQSCAASGLCGVTRLGYAPATATEAGAELYRRLVCEGVAVMRAEGHEPGPYLGASAAIHDIADAPARQAIDTIRNRASRLIADGYVGGTSLLRDLQGGIVSEVRFLMGDMLEAASDLDVPVPNMSAVTLAISAADQAR